MGQIPLNVCCLEQILTVLFCANKSLGWSTKAFCLQLYFTVHFKSEFESGWISLLADRSSTNARNFSHCKSNIKTSALSMLLIEQSFEFLTSTRCHVDQVVRIRWHSLTCSMSFLQKMTNEQNDVIKNFLFLCITLIVLGFILGPIILMIFLPCIVDDDNDDENESIDLSNARYIINNRKSIFDSDETGSLIDETASF